MNLVLVQVSVLVVLCVRGFQTCTLVFLSSSVSKNITSPNYPNNYPSNTDVCWVLYSPDSSYVVHAQVIDSDVEKTSSATSCTAADYVIAKDGRYRTSTHILQWCGTAGATGVGALTSTGRYMYIGFHSDGSIEKKGFKLSAKLVIRPRGSTLCKPVLANKWTHSYIESPGYPSTYANNLDTCWIVEAPSSDYAIKLSIIKFKLENPTSYLGCLSEDFVDIRDGKYSFSTRLAVICGTVLSSTVYKSTGRYMYIHFKSDGNKGEQGFKFEVISTQPPTTDPPPTEDPFPLLLGLSIGLPCGCIVLIYCIVWFCKRQSPTSSPSYENDNEGRDNINVFVLDTGGVAASNTVKNF